MPQDCFKYIFTHNFFPLIKKIADELGYCPKYLGTFFGQRLKHEHGQHGGIPFCTCKLYDLFAFLKKENLDKGIALDMLKLMFERPTASFEELLKLMGYAKASKQDLMERMFQVADTFKQRRNRKIEDGADLRNTMLGTIRPLAVGNVSFSELANAITTL